MSRVDLSIPAHFSSDRVGEIYRVPYQERAAQAAAWAVQHSLKPATHDVFRVGLLLIDVQNTFCTPGFELFVGGRTGNGAVDDTRRLCEFIYRNTDVITQIIPTMDTHQAMQIFHAIYLVNDKSEHPAPYTLIRASDIEEGVWRLDSRVAASLGLDPFQGAEYLRHYTRSLEAMGRYNLTIWPYHSMLGGIGHALVSALEEAIFFHSMARYSQPDFRIKGREAQTEHYSVLGPEVPVDSLGQQGSRKDLELIEKLWAFDALIIAGQARSHCVAWTIEDLLDIALQHRSESIDRIYLLEDCSSPVVVPGVVDYTDQADAAYARFAQAGMHVVRSSDPISSWPGPVSEL